MFEKETFSNQENKLRRQAEEKAAQMIDTLGELSPEESRRMLHELRVHQIELEMQNDELRQSHAELEVSQERCLDLYDHAPVGYVTVSESGTIQQVNLTAATMLGMARSALIRQPMTRFIHQEDKDIYYLRIKQLLKAGEPQTCELRLVKIDGTLIWALLVATTVQDAIGAPVSRVVLSDITERKMAEEEIQNLAKFPSENPNPVIRLREDGLLLYANEASEFIIQDWHCDIGNYAPSFWRDLVIDAIKDQSKRIVDVHFGYKIYAFDISPIPNTNYINIYGRNITEGKQAEDTLRKSEARLRSMFEGHGAIMLLTEPDSGQIVDANSAAQNFYGYSLQTLKEMTILDLNVLTQEEESLHREEAARTLQDYFVLPQRLANEEIRTVEVHSSTIAIGGKQLLFLIIHDITVRKIQEEKLQRLNRTLTALTHGRKIMMRAPDEFAYLRDICNIIVKDCGHAMIWIGYAEDDPEKSVRPIVGCGFNAGYIESLRITWADTERGRGPTGTAIRTGRVTTCVNMKTDPHFTPWCEESLKQGYASTLALPLMADGRCLGAISIYSGEPDAFAEDEIKLLTELADDLAFGIMSLRLRVERTRAEESLRSLLTEKEVLLKEVHHRVKNNLQVISSLISLQSDSLPEEQMQLIFSDLRNRVHSIALVHEKLYLSEDLSKLNFAEYATSLLNYLWHAGVTTAHNVRLNLLIEPLMLSIDSAVHCGLILNELITNALKYAFPGGREGEISVSLEHNTATGSVCLRVSDNGVGLPADFDLQQSNSLGLRLVQMLAGQMRGSVQTGSGPGAEFQISFTVKGRSS